MHGEGRGLVTRQHFAPVGQFQGINLAADFIHHRQIGLVEHVAHVLQLFHAHAMFAGNRTAQVDAHVQDLAGQRFGPFQRTGLAAVVENQRVQVAIPGVEDIGDAQVILFAQRFNFGERVPQPAARHHPILDNVVRAQPPDRGKGTLAPLPDPGPVRVIFGNPHFVRIRRLDHLEQMGKLGLDLDGFALQLDNQQGSSIRDSRR